MKTFYFLVTFLAIATFGYASSSDYNSRRCEELVLSADTVSIRGETETMEKGIEVKDRKWIEAFANALGNTHLSETERVFGLGWTTAYFYHEGDLVLSVTPIESHHLRAYSKKGGGDFIVTEKELKTITELMQEQKRPNSRS